MQAEIELLCTSKPQHLGCSTSMTTPPLTCDPGRADRVNLPRVLFLTGGYSPLCQSASRVKLILGLSSASKVEDLWTTRLGTAYCLRTPFSWIVVAFSAMHNSSHLVTSLNCP